MTLTLNVENPAYTAPPISSNGGGRAEAGHIESAQPPREVTKRLVELFKLLSDETRLRILLLLKDRQELNVRTLCQILRQSQPAVSHHLALLRVAGLIDMRRQGKHNFYRLLPKQALTACSAASSGRSSGTATG